MHEYIIEYEGQSLFKTFTYRHKRRKLKTFIPNPRKSNSLERFRRKQIIHSN